MEYVTLILHLMDLSPAEIRVAYVKGLSEAATVTGRQRDVLRYKTKECSPEWVLNVKDFLHAHPTYRAELQRLRFKVIECSGYLGVGHVKLAESNF